MCGALNKNQSQLGLVTAQVFSGMFSLGFPRARPLFQATGRDVLVAS